MNRYIINDKNNKLLYEGDKVKHIPFGNPVYAVEGTFYFYEGLWLGLQMENGEKYIFEPFSINSDEFELIESYEEED